MLIRVKKTLKKLQHAKILMNVVHVCVQTVYMFVRIFKLLLLLAL